jgi:hypothetical protein
MTDRLAWWGIMWLAVACCRCTADDAHASTRPRAAVDAGKALDGRGVTHAHARHLDAGASAEDLSQDSIMGLTRAQLLVRRGPPTEKRGTEWVYTPDQPGCREMIVSEIVAFKRNVVASVRLEHSRTGKVCRGPGRGL